MFRLGRVGLINACCCQGLDKFCVSTGGGSRNVNRQSRYVPLAQICTLASVSNVCDCMS